MKITAVDDAKDLFLVENIFPIDWLQNIPMDCQWQQLEHWPRKLLPTFGLHNDHPFAKMNSKLQSMEPYWMEFFGETVMVQEPRVWWDEPGFYMKAHIDGDVADVATKRPNPDAAMQIYLTDSQGQPGTTFYHTDDTERYDFLYKPNTGYLMRNHLQQRHGTKKNTTDQKRLSLYVGFQFDIKDLALVD